MEIIPGSLYIASNKFNKARTATWLVIGLIGAYGIGWLYGFLAYINPFIYLNILLLIGVIVALTILLQFVIVGAESRNKGINFLLAFVISLFAWYVNWSYTCARVIDISVFEAFTHPLDLFSFIPQYASIVQFSVGKGGGNGNTLPLWIIAIVYVIEFITFLWAAYQGGSHEHYYCEDCQKSLNEEELRTADTDIIERNIDEIKKGNIECFKDIEILTSVDKDSFTPDSPMVNYQFLFHSCTQCHQCNVLHMDLLEYKTKKEKVEIDKTTNIVKGIYLSAFWEDILASKEEAETTSQTTEETV